MYFEKIDVSTLRDAVNALERAIDVYNRKQNFSSEVAEVLRGGVIQCFEFTYELAWKFMNRWLKNNVTTSEPFSKKSMFRLCGEYGLIENVEFWFDFGQARNLTSHTYNEDTAENVLDIAIQFLPHVKDFLLRLEGLI